MNSLAASLLLFLIGFTFHPTIAESQVVEVTLESTDRTRFNTNEIRVPEGSTVRLTLVHTGRKSIRRMGHNFVLVTPGTDIKDLVKKANRSSYEDHKPKGDSVIAYTKLIGGGESVTIEFKAPKKGEYPFLCTYNKHYRRMKGILIVE